MRPSITSERSVGAQGPRNLRGSRPDTRNRWDLPDPNMTTKLDTPQKYIFLLVTGNVIMLSDDSFPFISMKRGRR